MTPASHRRVVWKRRIAQTGRWLHIYSSMASFSVVFFFAATGLTLNHADWFIDQQRVVEGAGALNPAWVAGRDADVARLEIVEFLRSAHRIGGAIADFRVEEGECAVSFKGPGYSADVFIDRTNGRYTLTETRLGFAAIVNDLHKGRDSGAGWRIFIDVSAVMLVLISFTGLLLIYFVHKHRLAGLLALTAGAMLSFGVYWLLVP